MNSWLVARHLKHGMMTVRRSSNPTQAAMTMPTPQMTGMSDHTMQHAAPQVPRSTIAGMAFLSIAVFALGLAIAFGAA